jgi:hypothetical protein
MHDSIHYHLLRASWIVNLAPRSALAFTKLARATSSRKSCIVQRTLFTGASFPLDQSLKKIGAAGIAALVSAKGYTSNARSAGHSIASFNCLLSSKRTS